MRRFRDYYGARPGHLLAALAAFVIVGGAFVDWFHASAHTANILVWFAASLVAVEFLLIPLAWVGDRVARTSGGRQRRAPRGAGWAYIRVPALLSGLLLIVFAPVIFRADVDTYRTYTASTPYVYLGRWLIATGLLFACSAVVYLLARVRRRRSDGAATDDHVEEANHPASAPAPRRPLNGHATAGPRPDMAGNGSARCPEVSHEGARRSAP
jgi:hypothetical protein